jgi:hypothetical protein
VSEKNKPLTPTCAEKIIDFNIRRLIGYQYEFSKCGIAFANVQAELNGIDFL